MSELLSDYVVETYAKAERSDISSWTAKNEPPYICDCRYGGMRVFLFKSGDNIVLVGKKGSVYTPSANPRVFSNVTEFVRAPDRMILDGEYLPGDGIHLFDVIHIDDRDIRSVGLRNRRRVLKEILEGTNLEARSKECQSQGEIVEFRDLCVASGGQGIVVKNMNSTYGAPGAWLEVGRPDSICCFVSDVDSLEKPSFLNIALLDSKNGRLLDLGIINSFSERVKRNKIAPGSVVEVKFQGVSSDMKLIDPFIVRVRTDRAPADCNSSQLDSALTHSY